MATVYFWTCVPKDYTTDQWRHVFCQWYKKDFVGGKATYDLSGAITQDCWDKYIEGKKFSSREKWMMVCKALLFAKSVHKQTNFKILDHLIIPIDDPKEIRKLGRTIKGFDEKVWDEWKYKFVVNGNYLQFSQDEELKKILSNTNDRELVEASPYDKIWGIGFTEKQAVKVNKSEWGSNLLGKALVEVRKELI